MDTYTSLKNQINAFANKINFTGDTLNPLNEYGDGKKIVKHMDTDSLFKRMQQLNDEYEVKMSQISDNSQTDVNSRFGIYKQHIGDVTDLNRLLIDIVQNQCSQTDEIVTSLKSQLKRGDINTKECLMHCRELEQDIRLSNNLAKEKEQRICEIKREISRDKVLMEDYKHDALKVVNVLNEYRASGDLNIDGIVFRILTIQQVFGNIKDIKKIKTQNSVLEQHISDLRSRIREKDECINNCSDENDKFRRKNNELIDEMHANSQKLFESEQNLKRYLEKQAECNTAASTTTSEAASEANFDANYDTNSVISDSNPSDSLNSTLNKSKSLVGISETTNNIRELLVDFAQERNKHAQEEHYYKNLYEKSCTENQSLHEKEFVLAEKVQNSVQAIETLKAKLKLTKEEILDNNMKYKENLENHMTQIKNGEIAIVSVEKKINLVNEEKLEILKQLDEREQMIQSKKLIIQRKDIMITNLETDLKNNDNLDSLKDLINTRDSQINNLRNKLLIHEKNGDDLHSKINKAKEDISKYQKKINKDSTIIKDYNFKIDKFKDEIKSLVESNETLTKKITTTVQAAKRKETEINNSQIRDLKTRIKFLEGTLASLQKSSNESNDNLKNKIKEINRELKVNNKNLVTAESKYQELQRVLSEHRLTFDETKSELATTHEKMMNITNEASKLSDKVKQLTISLKDQTDKNDALINELMDKEKEKEVHVSNLKFQQDRINIFEEKINTYCQELNESETLRSKADSTLELMQADLAFANDKFHKLKFTLKHQCDNYEIEKTVANEKIIILEKENSKLQNELNNTIGDLKIDSDAFQETIYKKNSEFEKLENLNLSLEKRCEELNQQKCESDEIVVSLSENIETQKKLQEDLIDEIKHKDGEIAALDNELLVQRGQHDIAFSDSVAQLRGQVAGVQEKLESKRSQLEHANALLQKKTKEIKEMDCDNTTLSKRCSSQSNKLMKKDELLNKLTTEMENMKDNEIINKKDLQMNEHTINQLKGELSNCMVANDNLNKNTADKVLQYEDQVRSLKLDLEALTGGIDDRDADITLLRNQLSDQELLLTKAEAQHSVCKQEVLNRDSDINELKTRYAENEQKVFSIQQELAISKNTLAGELLKTKQTYADMESTRKQLEHSRIQNCEMQDQLRSVEDIAEALRTDLKHCSLKLDKQAVECRDSIEILQVELDGCKKSLIHEQERFSESARTINSLQNKNNEKDEQISKSKKIYEEKSELENKLAIALQNIDQINAQLTLKEESECNLGESLSVSQFKLDGCSTQLEASQLRNRQLEQTLTKVSKDSEDKDDVIAELNNNLDILQSEYEEADLTSKAAQGTCDDLTGEIKYLHSQLSAVKQSSRDSDALVLTLRQDLDNAISENDRNIESAQNYQNKLISYQKRHTHSNDKFEEISENEKRLTYELENATHEIKINEKKRLEYNEDVMKMKVELASVQERKAQGDNEMQLLKNCYHDYELAKEIKDKEAAHIKMRIREVESDNGKLKSDAEELASLYKNQVSRVEELQGKLQQSTNNCNDLSEKCDKIELHSDQIKEKNLKQEQDIRLLNNKICYIETENERIKNELNEAHLNHKNVVQQLAHSDEQISLANQNTSSIRDTLTEKVTECVKFEHKCKLLQVELESLNVRCSSNAEELKDNSSVIDHLRKEVLTSKDECHKAVTLNITQRQKLIDCADTQILSEQISRQEVIIRDLQANLREEKQRFHDLTIKHRENHSEYIDSVRGEKDTLFVKCNNDLVTSKKECSEYKRINAQLKTQVASYEIQINDSRNACKNSQNVNELAQSQIKEYKNVIETLKNKIKKKELEEESIQDKNSNEDMSEYHLGEIEALRNQCSLGEATISSLHKQLDAQEQRNQLAQASVERCKRENSELTRKLHDQSDLISEIGSENRELKINLDESTDKEKITKALKVHSIQQQRLINRMQEKLEKLDSNSSGNETMSMKSIDSRPVSRAPEFWVEKLSKLT